jgi:hypothetical protein
MEKTLARILFFVKTMLASLSWPGLTRPSKRRRVNDQSDIGLCREQRLEDRAFLLFTARRQSATKNTWMAGSSPAMTTFGGSSQ